MPKKVGVSKMNHAVRDQTSKEINRNKVLKWKAGLRHKMEMLEEWRKDYFLEMNIDPLVDELAPDPLVDELKHEFDAHAHHRGDGLPAKEWLKFQPQLDSSVPDLQPQNSDDPE